MFGRNERALLCVASREYISENARSNFLASPRTRFIYAACGRNHSLLVGSEGRAWLTGANSLGQCGHPPCPKVLTYAPSPCSDRTARYVDGVGVESCIKSLFTWTSTSLYIRCHIQRRLSVSMVMVPVLNIIDSWIDVADGSEAHIDTVREQRRLFVRCHGGGLSQTSIRRKLLKA